MDMKRHMLICHFISILVGKERGEIIIRIKNNYKERSEIIINIRVIIRKKMK